MTVHTTTALDTGTLDTRTKAHARSRVGLLVLVCLLASACSGSATTTITETASTDVDQVDIVADEPTAVPEPTAEATSTTEPEPTSTPEIDLAPQYWGSDIQPGDCINRLPGNPPFEPPDIVSCDVLHEEEIYAKATLDFGPDEPYPGGEELAALTSAELCGQATIDFAGETWDTLSIPTLLLYPVEAEWLAGDRNIMCSVVSPTDGAFMVGTAAGGTIDTDDVLLARSGVAIDGEDLDDWAIFTEHGNIDTIGTLTDAQFDLPLRRPFPVAQGFVFNAKPAGDEGYATNTWGYNWETGEFTDLGSILPGQELASTMIADGKVIFAARETPDDDWDLEIAEGDEVRVLVGGEGDQQYPTLTPDLRQVVYQDRGDIWVVNIDGTDPRQITSGPATDWESAVSPDGRTVVFASDRSGNDDLWSVGIDGGDPVNLTNHPADELWPVFSDDGQYIYFSSDRLEPEDDRSRLMVMNADGSNQSWFGGFSGAQAIVVDDAFADLVVATAPTLDERYNFELITGEPGTTTSWTDSTGRLTADLPAGWRVGDVNEQPGFLVSPRPGRYFDVWEVDGVLVLLYEGETEAEFFAHYDATDAVQSCEQFDGTGEVQAVDSVVNAISGNFNCGSDGAVGGVLAFYNTETQVGVVIQGQRDNQPDADIDSQVITDIARSLTWG